MDTTAIDRQSHNLPKNSGTNAIKMLQDVVVTGRWPYTAVAL